MVCSLLFAVVQRQQQLTLSLKNIAEKTLSLKTSTVLRMARRRFTTKWQMHESSQRGLCRAAFVLLGVLPLLAVIVLSVAQYIPAYQARRAASWSSWLSNRLGVNVQIAAVELLAPERYVLHGLKIAHPESRAALGRVRSVAVSHEGAAWVIKLDTPELETRQLATTWQMLHDWFVCRP